MSIRDALLPDMLSGRVSPLDWTRWNDYDYHPPPSVQSGVASMMVAVVTLAAQQTRDKGIDLEGGVEGGDLEGMPHERFGGSGATAARVAQETSHLPLVFAELPPPLHFDAIQSVARACYVWLPQDKIINLEGRAQWDYQMIALPPTRSSSGWTMSSQACNGHS